MKTIRENVRRDEVPLTKPFTFDHVVIWAVLLVLPALAVLVVLTICGF